MSGKSHLHTPTNRSLRRQGTSLARRGKVVVEDAGTEGKPLRQQSMPYAKWYGGSALDAEGHAQEAPISPSTGQPRLGPSFRRTDGSQYIRPGELAR